MYYSGIHLNFFQSKEECKKFNGITINHFYEKSLSLKDFMNIPKIKEMIEEYYRFMFDFSTIS